MPIEIGHAVYGAVQDDTGDGVTIKAATQIANVFNFTGTTSQTAVWHFATDPSVHHFVIVPWYNQDRAGWSYTVFMAYENYYSVGNYVAGQGAAVCLYGYKAVWSVNEIQAMLANLLAGGTAWRDYFGQVSQGTAEYIKYWKYRAISVASALSNIQSHS